MSALLTNPQGASREEATLVDIEFRSPSGPWVIGRFLRPDGSDFAATGNFGDTILYEDFILYGQRKPDIQGADFDVTQFTSMPPKATSSLPGYLASLTGAQRSSTVKVVAHFGDHTIDILEKNPERLFEADIPDRDIERLHKGWIELRSSRLAMAKVDIEGIHPDKLSKLQRSLGYSVDLNTLIKEDPYLLYTHFDDMLFQSALSLGKRLGVPNTSLSAIKGAVIATLRREAWQGHSYVEGRPMVDSCTKLLGIEREAVLLHIKEAVTNLSLSRVIAVEDGRAQLMSLRTAERKLIDLAVQWSQLNSDDMDDIVPTDEMALKLLRPLKLGAAPARQISAGLRMLLGERFGLVQCETLADQMTIARAIELILDGYGTDVVFSTYTCEMADQIAGTLAGGASVVTYAALVGLDPDSGVPLQRAESPIETEVLVLIAADALGVEEMTHIMEAMPDNGRLFILGCPKDLPALTVGQPFEEMVKVRDIKCFQASFWLPARTDARLACSQIWSGRLQPKIDNFNPSEPLSWLNIPRDDLPHAIAELIKGLASKTGIAPFEDIRVVTPSPRANDPIHDISSWMAPLLAEGILGESEPVSFQGKQFTAGLPVVIRQPIAGTDHPAFSIFTPEEITTSTIKLRSKNRGTFNLYIDNRIDVFPATVIAPKFIRGRIYDFVILIVLKEHHDLINQELISTLLNSTKSSLVIAGEIEGLGEGFKDRPRSRARSKLSNWISLDVD